MSKARGLADLGNVYNDGALSNRNLVINGAMQVAQRGTSYADPQNYTLDRWKTLRYAAANYTVSQQDTGGLSGFTKCTRVQRNAGDTQNTAIALNQPVEQKNCNSLIGKTVTLSFWVRVGANFSTTPTNFLSSIAYTTNATDIGMFYDNFTSNGTSLAQQMPTSTSWSYVTMSATIPSSAKQVGVSFLGTSWSGTAGANDYYEITGVQLEVGDTATPFEHRSYGQELALCQRYYYKFGDGTYFKGNYVLSSGNGLREFTFTHPTTMRSTPTIINSGTSWSGGYGIQNQAATIHNIGFNVLKAGTGYTETGILLTGNLQLEAEL